MPVRRILITSPSLNVKENVSGISSLVADILNYSQFKFLHLQLGSKDGFKKNLAWAGSQLSAFIKVFLTSIFRKYEIVHLNVGLEKNSIIRDSMVFFIVKGIFNKKVILHVHGGFFLMNEAKSRMLNFMLKKIFNKAEAVIVLSNLEKGILEKRYGNLSFHVFPNAVDIASIKNMNTRVSSEKVRFIFIGRIIKTKGIYTISESMKYLSKYFDRFSLSIFGNGPEVDEWIASLNKIEGLDYTYNGVVGGSDKWKALYGADVFLLPALHSEGMPIAMLEAMAAACVVVVTDVASIKTVIKDYSNGILLSESSPEQLASVMEKLILGKADKELIGQNAMQYVQNNLSLPNYIHKLEDLYISIS